MKTNLHSFLAGGVGLVLMTVACSHQLADVQPVTEPAATLPVIRFGNELNGAKFLSQNIPFPVQADASAVVNTTAIEQLLTQLLNAQKGNVDALRPTAGAEPRYVAVGGSAPAGWRDGGLYRAGQLTSYPNLIAQQMGLKNFKQPLFSVEQGNGTGYKQWLAGTDLPRYTEVTNNRAVVSTNPLTLAPYNGAVGNLGMPYLGEYSIRKTDIWRVDANLIPGNYAPAFYTYFRRLLPNTDNRQWTTFYYDVLYKQPADICTIELGLDDLISYATTGGTAFSDLETMGHATGLAFRAVVIDMKRNGAKCVISTIPDVRKFPYFRFYTVATARQKNKGSQLFVAGERFGQQVPNPATAEGYVGDVSDQDILIASNRIEDLFSSVDKSDKIGLSRNYPLLNRDVLSGDELRKMNNAFLNYNQIIDYSSKEYSVPVVDIASLYERILKGGYITEDGVKVDPNFPNGNFFSQDGLYPTALGQAVIANEWIKVFNQAYKTTIPLVPTKQFVSVK